MLTAGQVGFDENGDLVSDEIEPQARQVFDNLRHCLEAAGSSLDHVLKVTTFLADLADFEAYNDVYQQYFSAPYPARTPSRRARGRIADRGGSDRSTRVVIASPLAPGSLPTADRGLSR